MELVFRHDGERWYPAVKTKRGLRKATKREIARSGLSEEPLINYLEAIESIRRAIEDDSFNSLRGELRATLEADEREAIQRKLSEAPAVESRIVTDPDWQPPCWGGRWAEFAAWRRGVNPSFRPSRADFYVSSLLDERERRGTDRQPGQPSVADEAIPTDAILWHGSGCVSVPGADPFVVSDNEDTILQSFLETAAMDGPTLVSKSGIECAGKLLRALATKYDGKLKPFITLPGGKGKSGYAVNIRRAQ